MIRLLKRLRVSQPFNGIATTLARAGLRALNAQPEFVVRHLHRAGTVKSSLPDGQTILLWSRGDDWISNQLFWRGLAGYEPETIPLFLRLATTARVTMDVGAYVGLYALLAALSNRASRVFAFEPHPAIYDRLVRNVRLNRLANVECVRAAAGRDDSEGTLYHIASGLPSSSSLSRPFMEDKPALCGTAVKVVALDRFLRDRNVEAVDLVKIDTETTEGDVLAGMQETLRRDRPAIVCEILPGSPGAARAQELLEPLGYRYHLLTPRGPVRKDRIEGDAEYLNYLFTTRLPS